MQLVDHVCNPPRLEIKYVLPHSKLGSMQAYLQNKFRLRAFNQPVSRVHSVYLDSHSLQRVAHCLAGLPLRNKLRLRWYDSAVPGKYIYLELKEKKGLCSSKERCCLHTEESASLSALLELAPQRLWYQILQGSVPVVHIQYSRMHFEHAGTPIRITLDYNLQTARPHPQHFCRNRGKMISFGSPIVEIKAPPDCTARLSKLLASLPLRKARYSKYLQACRQFGPLVGNIAGMITEDGL